MAGSTDTSQPSSGGILGETDQTAALRLGRLFVVFTRFHFRLGLARSRNADQNTDLIYSSFDKKQMIREEHISNAVINLV